MCKKCTHAEKENEQCKQTYFSHHGFRKPTNLGNTLSVKPAILSSTRRKLDARMRRSACFLHGVPKPSVFLEFVRRPHQPKNVADAATDNNTLGAEVLSEDQSKGRHTHRANERIDKENLLLMGAQIVCLRKDNDIRDHINHQHGDRAWI